MDSSSSPLPRTGCSACGRTKCPSLYLIPCISAELICFRLSAASKFNSALLKSCAFLSERGLNVIRKQSSAGRWRSLKTPLRLANQCGHSRRAAVRAHAAPGRRERRRSDGAKWQEVSRKEHGIDDGASHHVFVGDCQTKSRCLCRDYKRLIGQEFCCFPSHII